MRLARPLTSLLLTLIVAALGTFGMQARANADVQVTVTPNEGLRDGQTVHVKASGLPALHSPIQVVECAPGALDSSKCDGDTLDVSEDTDAQGNYDNPHFVVRTRAQNSHNSIDCDVSHPCEIYVGVDYNNTFKVASGVAPIAFSVTAGGANASSSKSGSSVPVLPIVAGVVVILVGLALYLRGRKPKSSSTAPPRASR